MPYFRFASIPFLALCILVLSSNRCSAQDEPEFDLSVLEGTWKPLSGMIAGQPLPKATLDGMTLKLDATSYLLETNGLSDAGKLSFDVSKTPKEIDIVGEEGPNAGRTILAIFKIDANRLTICYTIDGAERPKEFAAPKDSQILLLEYERQK